MGKGTVFTTTQVWAIVILVGILALFVGLMCGLTPACVPEGNTSSAKRSVGVGEQSQAKRGKRADDKPWENLRLPEEIKPDNYTLTVEPDLTGSDTFKGKIDILITVSAEIEYPRIHMKDINVTLSQIIDEDGNRLVEQSEAFYYAYNEFYVMDVGVMQPGQYTWKIEYTGGLAGKIVGFYKSSYKVPGETETR